MCNKENILPCVALAHCFTTVHEKLLNNSHCVWLGEVRLITQGLSESLFYFSIFFYLNLRKLFKNRELHHRFWVNLFQIPIYSALLVVFFKYKSETTLSQEKLKLPVVHKDFILISHINTSFITNLPSTVSKHF